MAFGLAPLFRRPKQNKAHVLGQNILTYPKHGLNPSSWTTRSPQRPAGFIARAHLEDGYLRDWWENVFSMCEGSDDKLLVGHLLRDGSRLGEDVPGQ